MDGLVVSQKMKSRMRKRSLILATIAFAVLIAGIALERLSRSAVVRTIAAGEANVEIHLESIHPSSSFGLYFKYVISGHTQLNKAYWRMIPFGQIDVEK